MDEQRPHRRQSQKDHNAGNAYEQRHQQYQSGLPHQQAYGNPEDYLTRTGSQSNVMSSMQPMQHVYGGQRQPYPTPLAYLVPVPVPVPVPVAVVSSGQHSVPMQLYHGCPNVGHYSQGYSQFAPAQGSWGSAPAAPHGAAYMYGGMPQRAMHASYGSRGRSALTSAQGQRGSSSALPLVSRSSSSQSLSSSSHLLAHMHPQSASGSRSYPAGPKVISPGSRGPSTSQSHSHSRSSSYSQLTTTGDASAQGESWQRASHSGNTMATTSSNVSNVSEPDCCTDDCCESTSTVSEAITPNFPIIATASSWSSLTAGLLQSVVLRLLKQPQAGPRRPSQLQQQHDSVLQGQPSVGAGEQVASAEWRLQDLLGGTSAVQDPALGNLGHTGLCALSAALAWQRQHDVLSVLRLVCRHWRAVVDNSVEALRPRVLKLGHIVTRFPHLRALALTQCSNIRNRDFYVLGRGGLSLQALALGDDSSKPWVTNHALIFISRMHSLTQLHLHGCNSLTNNGLVCLSVLTGLTHLSVRSCRKLTSAGMEAVTALTGLRSLDVAGASRLGDSAMLVLSRLEKLERLELGGTSVRDGGMLHVGRMSRLRSLRLVGEDVTDTGLVSLAGLSGLRRLSINECGGMSGAALAALLQVLSNLQCVELSGMYRFGDEQLSSIAGALPLLTSLALSSTGVTPAGIAKLASAEALARLCLSLGPMRMAPAASAQVAAQWAGLPAALPSLSHLSSLALVDVPVELGLCAGLLHACQALPALSHLDVSAPTLMPPPVPQQQLPRMAAAAAEPAAAQGQQQQGAAAGQQDGPPAVASTASPAAGAAGAPTASFSMAAAASASASTCTSTSQRTSSLGRVTVDMLKGLLGLPALKSLSLSGRVLTEAQARQLMENLPCLTWLGLAGCGLDAAALRRLHGACPDVCIITSV